MTQSREDDLDTPEDRNEDTMNWDFESSLGFDDHLEDIRSPGAFIARGDITDVRYTSYMFHKDTQLNSPSIRDEIVPAVCTSWIHTLVQLYTIQGQIVHRPPSDVTFSIPGIISSADLDPILPYLPTVDVEMDERGSLHEPESFVPREKGRSLIKKMLQLNKLAEDIYRIHAHRCDHAWELMMEDGFVPRVSLEDIALKVFQTDDPAAITTPMLWCLHRSIGTSYTFRMDKQHHRLAPKFQMLSPEKVHTIQTVQQWMRTYQEELASDTTAAFEDEPMSAVSAPHLGVIHEFVRKAREVIDQSRISRDPSPIGRLSPDKRKRQQVDPLRPIIVTNSKIWFSQEDAKILRCILDWVLFDTGIGPISFIGPAILRAVGMYDGYELDRATGMILLQELSILMPWEDKATYMADIVQPLPGYGSNAAIDRLHSQAVTATPTLEDSMADLRKDWKDLPVFCVDSMSTRERDDGVSWEPIDESTGWAHIHVANPSAFIEPSSVTARFAAKLPETLYLPQRKIEMLEPESVRKHCGLAPNAPTITFSAKLTIDGDVQETKITHGVVRNVRFITYETVSQILFPTEGSADASQTVRTVGGELPIHGQTPRDESLTAFETDSLRRLMEFGHARRLKRVEGTDLGSRFQFFNKVEPSVYLGEKPPLLGFSSNHIRNIIGDPIISLRNRPYDPKVRQILDPSYEFVSDLMLLAGEVASKWCAARGIPIVYLGTNTNPQLVKLRQKFTEDVYNPVVAEHGYAPDHILLRRAEYFGVTTISAEPCKHDYLNLPSYTRISSPLRRYGDLFSHWQIDAAVRQEARTGTSLVGNTDDSFLPFSLAESKEVISELRIKTAHLATKANNSRRHWIMQWFNRAYYHNEAPIPKKFHIYISRIIFNRPFGQAIILELGIQCTVEKGQFARVGGLLEGDTWEAEVDELDLYRLAIKVRLIQLVKRSPFKYQSWMPVKVD